MSRLVLLLAALSPLAARAQPAPDAGIAADADAAPVVNAPAPATPTPSPPASNPPVRDATVEVSAGVAFVHAGNSTDIIHGLGGMNFGFGKFVTPEVAVSLRVSGLTLIYDGIVGYVGMIGPHAQLWLSPQAWIGAGLGVGFVGACATGGNGGGCDGTTFWPVFDVRAGVGDLSKGGANLSVEVESASIGGQTLTAVSFLVGYQAF
jgi:hypothetical protein